MALRKNILFLPSWYPNRTAPSLGNFIQRHAAAVAEYHDVAVLYAVADASLSSKFETELSEHNGVNEVIVYYRKVNFAVPGLAHLLKRKRLYEAYTKGYKIIKEQFGEPQVVHVHVIWRAILFALYLYRQYKIPYIISEHWSGYMQEDGSYKDGLNYQAIMTRTGVKHASAVIAVSERMKEAMLAHGLKNNYSIIPNVVDTNLFHPAKEPRAGKARIIHVSTVNDREKNISGILRVVKKLSGIRNDFVLEIVGDSAEREGFERLAKELGILEKHVIFSGHLTIDKVAERMRDSHFFLMFSNYEGLPCVILEAFASGIPVLATNTGGIPQVMNNERGMLVNVKDEDALLSGLMRLIDTHKSYSAEALRSYAVDRFSYHHVGAQIAEIYDSLGS